LAHPSVPAGRRPRSAGRLAARAIKLRAAHPRHRRAWALGLFAILALLTIGWYPLSDPSRVCACSANTDPATYMWALAWWPHAILHGLNPFFSHYVWAPTGANITRSATIPTAALALSPVTELFGPVVAYNVLNVLSVTLAAFTAYLLCRRITGREWPALAGGYLFGFGSFELAQVVNHPNISLILLIPVMVHLALARADREISARRYIVALAAVLAAQAGLSSEILATAVVMGLILLLCSLRLAPASHRARVAPLITETIAACWLTGLLISPFLYYALIQGGTQQEWPLADGYGLDLLNPLFPTQVNLLGGHAFHALSSTFEFGNPSEADGYLSLPVLIAFIVWFFRTRRRFLARILMLAAGVSFLAALGSHLHVAGIRTVGLPFDWVKTLPVFRLTTPSRIAVYTGLAFAVGVSVWLAEPSRRLRGIPARWIVFALSAAMLFPHVATGLWGGTEPNPAFFSGNAYRRYLTRGETVLVMPYGWNGDSMLWQAETGFYFRMPGGYLGHIAPSNFEGSSVVGELFSNKAVNPLLLGNFFKIHHVGAVVLDERAGLSLLPFALELESQGLHGISVAGVLLFKLPANAVAAGAI
jgi:hypothetical protein